MEQHALKIVNSCWNIKITFYLVPSSGQRLDLYLNAVYILNTTEN